MTYLGKFVHPEQSGGHNRMHDKWSPLTLCVWDSCFDPDDPLRSGRRHLVRVLTDILDHCTLPVTYACGAAGMNVLTDLIHSEPSLSSPHVLGRIDV